MKEDEINKIFARYTRQLIKKLDKKALWSDTIDQNGERLFGKMWRGCHAHDNIKLENGYQILNTASSKAKKGIHWVAIYITPATIYVYDSFGRDTDSVLKSLKKGKGKRKIVESKRDSEQTDTSQICGHLCIAWLLCVQKLGIRYALKI